ncbi:MAG: DUF6518 family protein [Atopobiaceae bacterium]|nr:DUF6518 family protein [Atopobiaceae bacterium]
MTNNSSAPQLPTFGISLLLGFLVGTLSILGDIVSYDMGLVFALLNVFSTGGGWILLSIIVGWISYDLRRALINGISSITLAMLVYYGAIIFFNIRLQTDSADLIRVALIWIVLGVMCSGVLSPATWLFRHGTATQKALVSGYIGGLLASEPLFILWTFGFGVLNIGEHGMYAAVHLASLVLALLMGGLSLYQRKILPTTLAIIAGVVSGYMVWNILPYLL